MQLKIFAGIKLIVGTYLKKKRDFRERYKRSRVNGNKVFSLKK